ncbi:MAG: class I SAM-dependent methyltransferase [Proteobacteria bacterium]|nr:class I SAM-dependent methyltransferase [Pseudomonadota bacterium]
MNARWALWRLRDGARAALPATQTPLLDVEGTCPVCDQETRFQAWDPWLRDSFICVRCHSVPRQRAFYTVLERVCPNWRDLEVHESSPSESSGKLARECRNYTATQYDPSLPPGGQGPGWRNENLEAQTFADGSFDLVITQDVFEHLFEPDRAIAEIARTLRPGGLHMGTAPLARAGLPSVRRARRTADGAVEHLDQPLHHANPIDEQGSLVTIDWGYDIADYFDAHGGLNTTIHALDDLSRGIRGALLEVLVSRKAAPPTL